jgi:valyl-tRNA synthetase
MTTQPTDEFPPHFQHATREREIYAAWESSGAFVADNQSARKPYVISMPPPNATGTLHLGHAVMLAIEDLMIRWRRMAGDEALWVPGTDHAAIATESTVIKLLQKKGMKDPRKELGREGLLREISDYIANSRATIRGQVRAMGASCDWSRERYTMDPELNRIVNETFGKMFRDGLIYRGNRIVNWDVALRTTVSDDEIYHEERDAFLYTIQYGPFRVATSRPETKLGDTALAVHPDDVRYQQYIGQELDVAWPKGPTIRVRVVADSEVDPEFGTGVLGVTPAHSLIDFDIAQRHGLPMVVVIGEDGRMTPAAGPYAGMSINACREAFVKDLEEAGLLVAKKAYRQSVGICYRSGKPVEFLPKQQWFIDVNRPAVRWDGKMMSIRQVLTEVVRSHQIRIVPEYFEKTYFHWIDNLHDWCISRQIWWGHRVPVWYRGSSESYAGPRVPEGDGWSQDPDTLDTWFSSALWTWSTLVDPALTKDFSLTLEDILERSPDYHRFHPTSVMETGYDILFFWVARMILMTTYVTGRIPFEKVYLHGMILDKNGDKMSKSKPDLCIDPLETIRDKGADTLRLALVTGYSPGTDARMSEEKIKGASRFVNKLWNAAKYVKANADFGGRTNLSPETGTATEASASRPGAPTPAVHAAAEPSPSGRGQGEGSDVSSSLAAIGLEATTAPDFTLHSSPFTLQSGEGRPLANKDEMLRSSQPSPSGRGQGEGSNVDSSLAAIGLDATTAPDFSSLADRVTTLSGEPGPRSYSGPGAPSSPYYAAPEPSPSGRGQGEGSNVDSSSAAIGPEATTAPDATLHHPVNQWMWRRLNEAVAEVTAAFNRDSYGDAADVLRNAFWTDFCDFYLEATKAEDLASLEETRRLLGHALDTYLKLLHPYIPFVTEEIWSRTAHEGFLMHQSWPLASIDPADDAAVAGVDILIRLVTAIRNWRAKRELKWNVEVDIQLHAKQSADVLAACIPLLRKLVSVRTVTLTPEPGGEILADEGFDLVTAIAAVA